MIRFYVSLFLVMPKSLLLWLIYVSYADLIYIDIYQRDCCDRMEYYGTSRASQAFLDTALQDIDDLYYRFAEC